MARLTQSLFLLLLCMAPVSVWAQQGAKGSAAQPAPASPAPAATSNDTSSPAQTPETLAAPADVSDPVDLLALDPAVAAQMGVDIKPQEEKKMDMNEGPIKRKPQLKPPSAAAMRKARKAIPASKIVPNQGVPEDISEALKNFSSDFSFPMTEKEMIAFARAAVLVDRVNSKWDIEIAGAETDSMAIEYSNFAIEELENALKSIQGLTRQQYNEMTGKTAQDKDFARMFSIYKQLAVNGAFGKAPIVTLQADKQSPSFDQFDKKAGQDVKGNGMTPQGTSALPQENPPPVGLGG